MGDDVVDKVAEAFRDVTFANSIAEGAAHPVFSAIVNRLRQRFNDDDILEILTTDLSDA